MIIAASLLLYSILIGRLIPGSVIRVVENCPVPRLAVGVWVAAIFSVIASWLTATVFLVLDLADPRSIATTCLVALGALAPDGHGFGLPMAALIVSLLILARPTWTAISGLLLSRRLRRRHVDAARILGTRVPGVDAIVIDTSTRAAYCLPGKPHTVVITSGVLRSLSSPQLAAVLAHERAHLAGRHHLLINITRALRHAFPRNRLFAEGESEIGRLLEMCADDVAVRRHGTTNLIGALALLSSAAAPPTTALAAAGPGAITRANRLLAPRPPGSHFATSARLTVAGGLYLFGPVVAVIIALASGGLCVVSAA